MRISDWSSDVCSSDLAPAIRESCQHRSARGNDGAGNPERLCRKSDRRADHRRRHWRSYHGLRRGIEEDLAFAEGLCSRTNAVACHQRRQAGAAFDPGNRSEEHTSELQSLMRISYAVFCLKKKTNTKKR